MKCEKCKQPMEQDEIVLYNDRVNKRVSYVCNECDADIQWMLNPLFPPVDKNFGALGKC